MGYILNSAMTPLLPYVLARLHLAEAWQTPAAATWMGARVVVMAVMWRAAFWHGRWGTLLLGGIVMTLGVAIVVSGWSAMSLLIGLALFGCGMGIVYYAALYYAMAVGKAEVDAGGTHEALIGCGYTLGPALVLTSGWAASEAPRVGMDVRGR
jgi:hypothetical protein